MTTSPNRSTTQAVETKQGRYLGYARVSSYGQIDNTSLDEQTRRIEATASFHGVKVTRMFRDEGVSGSIPLGQRPAGFELLAGAMPGDVIVVSRLDRAFRSTLDALAVIEKLRVRGIGLILTDLSMEPLTNDGVGRLFFTIMAALADFERERIRERTMAGRRRKAEEGGFLGGRVPKEMRVVGEGKEKRVEVDPANAEVLEYAKLLRSKGVALRDIEVLVKEQFPNSAFAQSREFYHWHRYFRRIRMPVIEKSPFRMTRNKKKGR